MKNSKLYLIPTPISEQYGTGDILLPMYHELISQIDIFVTETLKTARANLKGMTLSKKIQDMEIYTLNEHTTEEELREISELFSKGINIGLMSDAGVPSVADPGYRLVALAQKAGVEIVPLVGPSSILLALMASGLNGQSFSFNGYLPKEKGLKRKRIKTLERIAVNADQTQIFMETPYKNQSMLEDVLDVCEEDTRLCIAYDIMGREQFIKTMKIGEWKRENPTLPKKPCLFLINK